MGLFSFLKSAGSKLIGNKAAANDEKSTPTTNSSMDALKAAAEKSKAALLASQVVSHGIKVDNMDITVSGETVTVYGQVE